MDADTSYPSQLPPVSAVVGEQHSHPAVNADHTIPSGPLDQSSVSTLNAASVNLHGSLSSRSQTPSRQQQAAFHPVAAPVPRTAASTAPQTPLMDAQPGPASSRARSPQQDDGYQSERPLNVTDALGYLDAVKQRFHDRPDVYNRFLDIMKDFKTQIIDTPGVIERVSHLFFAHPDLIHGFNTFLPVGYRIDAGSGGSILVTTPSGVTSLNAGQLPPSTEFPGVSRPRSSQHGHHPTALNAPPPAQPVYHPSVADTAMHGPAGLGPGAPSHSPYAHPTAVVDPNTRVLEPPSDPQFEFQKAIAYVSKIKTRFNNDPDTYKAFLELLQKHQDVKNIEVQEQISVLLQGAPDLQAEFRESFVDGRSGSFLGSAANSALGSNPHDWMNPNKRKDPSSGMAVPPAKRKKKVQEKEPLPSSKPPSSVRPKKPKPHPRIEQADDYMYDNGNGITAVGGGSGYMGMGASTPEDQVFFEKVKKTLDNRETYDEFLKLLNLFTQDIIDMRTLIDKSATFLGEGSELHLQLRRLLGWTERERLVREPDDTNTIPVANHAIYVPHEKDDLHHKCGPSYRRIPANEAHVACSGRDALCRSVLNDEWVSHPTWASEDNSGYQSHKKNVYEEALHKCEEERHEFDFHLEIMTKTISALENINMKIQQMTNEEKSTFKLKPGLGLPNKSIYQRIIKKVYGKDPGMEVIATLHDCPAIAVPIVLNRLRAKDDDWRRAQREWNKVWREVDARNFYKSLDHQGVTFKATDKKALTTKSLVAAIEAARDEQVSERAAMMDPSLARTRPAHQLAYELTDLAVMKDTTSLILAYLERLGAHYTAAERDKIERWLVSFVVAFFVLDKEDFENAVKGAATNAPTSSALGVTNMVPAENGALTMDVDPDETEAVASGRRTPKTKKGKSLKSGNVSRIPSAKATPIMQAAELPKEVKEDGPMPVDSVWIGTQPGQTDTATSNVRGAADPKKGPAANRKASFFGNTITYVILRIFQTLYSRLLLCKEITQQLSTTTGTHTANPIAIELGLIDGLGPGTMNLFVPNNEAELNPDGTPFNPTSRFYAHLLECCESLFAGDMDQNTFEENLRFMFGTKGYLMFTVDKVIAALIKQIHAAISDPQTEELISLLRTERRAEDPSTQQIITYRRNAEEIIGQDDNLFRINWDHSIMTIQLLGKTDPSTDDAETIAQRWRRYIESYVLTHPTEGIKEDVKNPFLRRTVMEAPLTETGCHADNGLEIRVCIRTYKLFFGPETEDYFWRYGDGARKQAMERLAEIDTKRKERFESWLESRRAKIDKSEKSDNGVKKTETAVEK